TLFSGRAGAVVTSENFGLGDWSLPGGMGFWGYQNDAQIDRDDALYTQDKKDAEIMQTCTIRVGTANGTSAFTGFTIQGVTNGFSSKGLTPVPATSADASFDRFRLPHPALARLPGTAVYLDLSR